LSPSIALWNGIPDKIGGLPWHQDTMDEYQEGHDIFALLTIEPNAEAGKIHRKAMRRRRLPSAGDSVGRKA
jgi:hypothetical protein